MGLKVIIAVGVLLAGCSGLSVERSAQNFHVSQAQSRMAEYMQAQRNGDLLGMCVKSNLISASYRDGGDEANAAAWQAKNADDCQHARDVLAPDLGETD